MTGTRGGLALLLAGFLLFAAPGATVIARVPNVLTVGPSGTPGAQYTSIQVAVAAAQPGDWVLVAPGVYHEKGSNDVDHPAGVFIQKSGIHLRGMNRNQVIVDGTNVVAGNATPTSQPIGGSSPCPSSEALQDLGPLDNGSPAGRNGILVLGRDGNGNKFLADGVSVENLSVCNFQTGSNGNGNQVWWNGGDGTGEIGMHTFSGDYLSVTDTFYKTGTGPAGQYGIFTSNESGSGVIDHSYSSNMRDSGFYIGACPDCNATLRNSRAQANSDGFSGTNAGGNLVIKGNEFDHGRTGLTSNAQNNDDLPPPQKGQCPVGVTPQAGAAGCTYFVGNHVHDNNNPNTPGSGLTAVSAIGSGMEMVATQHNTLVGNIIDNQGSWGIITFDFPDPESTGPCTEGTPAPPPPAAIQLCFFQSLGNVITGNVFTHVGYFGNQTNADIADQALYASTAAHPTAALDPNCFHDNHDTSGTVTGYPNVPPLDGLCSPGTVVTTGQKANLTVQLVCATGAVSLFSSGQVNTPCPPGVNGVPFAFYPTYDPTKCGTPDSPGILTPANDFTNGKCLLPLSASFNQTTMPDPCAGVPVNAYCPAAAPNTILPLPNTSAAGSLLAPALVGALGALGLGTALVRRRRRFRTD